MVTRAEFDQLRAECDEWRRRAEVAEAVAGERLARAETAERALRAAEAVIAGHPATLPADAPEAAGPAGEAGAAGEATPTPPAEPRRPASLIERWRRYTETLT